MKKRIAICIIALFMALVALPGMAAETDDMAILRAELNRVAQTRTDAWERYLLMQEPEDATLERDASGATIARFSLPAWNPGLNAAQRLSGDPLDKMRVIGQNIERSRVDATATINDATVQIDDAFYAQIREAAQKARRDFDEARFREMLSALLMPDVSQGASTQALSALYDGEFSQALLNGALACLRARALSVSEGPGALRMACNALDPVSFAPQALDDAMTELSGIDKANALSRAQIEDAFYTCLAARASAAWKGRPSTTKVDVRIDFAREGLAQARNADFEMYVRGVAQSVTDQIDALAFFATTLPDYPKRDLPADKALISAQKGEGTRVIFVAPDDGHMHCASLTDESGTVAALVFLRPGRKTDAYVKEGSYRLTIGEGEDWYGETALFGDGGLYAQSAGTLKILDALHYHRITLSAVTGANTRMRVLSPEEITK